MDFKVIVVGGGISGLSAAWYLRGLGTDCAVFEAGNRWGGRILTERIEGDYVVEGGPDCFLTQKPWALELARELGLEDQLLGTNDEQRGVYVISRGKPVRLPEGVLMIVPTKFMPFAVSPLISWPGKLRMGLDLVIPARRDDVDETLADFVTRRLGVEALDKIAEPLMSGIYNAEADRQSILATFPRFRQIEKDHGSLMRGMLAARRQRRTNNGESKLSIFMSFVDGLETMVDALVAQLQSDLRLETRVHGIQRTAGGGYELQLAGGETVSAETVVLATPAYAAADLLQPLAPAAAELLASIRYVSTGTVSLAYLKEEAPGLLPGTGVMVPRSEGRPVNAITISSVKFDRRAPADSILLRVFFGGSRSPQSMDLNDEELLATVRRELADIMGIHAAPAFQRIYRWHRANPQYDVGHLDRVAAIEAGLPAGIYVTGSPYRGVGLPDCVHQSQLLAQKIMARRQEEAQ